ncbi:hypothetical protein K0M31_007174 [Melipona bicolor]|uniref:Uncharacterized protein n=1 Tax=Melipona bicolor TaxID=60889 RepID=A0AA40KKU7_9HYME|nr:hypothetical protein K0M31_007174 [Melipona bicolor]
MFNINLSVSVIDPIIYNFSVNKNPEEYLDLNVNPLHADLTGVDNFRRASSLKSQQEEKRKSFPSVWDSLEIAWPPMETVRLPSVLSDSRKVLLHQIERALSLDGERHDRYGQSLS